MIKYERISFTKDMLKGMYYIAMKVKKIICSHKEYKIAYYEERRNVD